MHDFDSLNSHVVDRMAGLGYGKGAHAPNEIYLVDPRPDVPIAGLATIEKAYVELIFTLAEQAVGGKLLLTGPFRRT